MFNRILNTLLITVERADVNFYSSFYYGFLMISGGIEVNWFA